MTVVIGSRHVLRRKTIASGDRGSVMVLGNLAPSTCQVSATCSSALGVVSRSETILLLTALVGNARVSFIVVHNARGSILPVGSNVGSQFRTVSHRKRRETPVLSSKAGSLLNERHTQRAPEPLAKSSMIYSNKEKKKPSGCYQLLERL